MHTHTVEYHGFLDKETDPLRKKVLYFNLTEAELTKIQKDYLHVGGVQAVMNAAVESGDTKQLLDFFEFLVHASYGIVSPDGEIFDKGPELIRQFENAAYYSPLYMSFMQEEGRVGSRFIQSVMPPELIAKAEKNVRGEGDLAKAQEAAANYRPDARTIFEQRQAEKTQNVFDEPGFRVPAEETVVVAENPSVEILPQSSQKYVPQNQPAYPSISTEPKDGEQVFTRAEWEAQQQAKQDSSSE